MPIRKMIYYGNVCDIEEHPAPAYGKNKQRMPTNAETSESQEKLNDRHAAEKIMRLIRGNFQEKVDQYITLTEIEGCTEEEAWKHRKALLGKLRVYFRKQGKELKYIIVTEKQGEWHHHLIMNRIPVEELMELWEGGSVKKVRALSLFDDYESLSTYLVTGEKPSRDPNAPPEEQENAKEARKKGARRFSCSQNLQRPVVDVKKISRVKESKPKPPKGYTLQNWHLWQDKFGDTHSRYRCIWAGSGEPPKTRRNPKGRKAGSAKNQQQRGKSPKRE